MVSMKMTTKMKITKKEENPLNEDGQKIKTPDNKDNTETNENPPKMKAIL